MEFDTYAVVKNLGYALQSSGSHKGQVCNLLYKLAAT